MSLFMMNEPFLGLHPLLFAALIVWSMVWKGFALWKAAAEKKSLVWFIVLFVVNFLGILEILYIFVFSKMDKKKRPRKR